MEKYQYVTTYLNVLSAISNNNYNKKTNKQII